MRQAKEKFLSQYMVDRHQKIVKHGETDVASLLSSLQVPNVSKPDDIQSIKQYVDHQQNQMKQQIGGLEGSIRKLTRTLEKFVAPSLPSYETSNRISMSNTSAINGDLQPQPLYGMLMNSYPGQVPPLPSLFGRSMPLNTVGPSVLLPGPSGRPIRGSSGLLCRTVRGRPRTTVVPAWQIGDLRRSRTIRASAQTVRPLRGPSGFLCRTVRSHTRTNVWRPNNGKHDRPVRMYHRTNRIHICRTCCCTPCTKLLHTTTAVCFALYIFKP
jgi:hypothetical protein